uniref:Sulfonate/nitrate/taurine transport system substrate-binding protein n=2 Tax=Candidatus Bipolaricaulota TaxID=67810 RepID=H5SMH9_9BACT|nr:sulfonate/nitrate/taurine transport system substrate-binding protein [uncultured Acetothermia bacterium]BAL58881.1 sulfonate/nitrate/taurine transport system substrate-binding protein [Candidatus Acetothermum autotrophicum]
MRLVAVCALLILLAIVPGVAQAPLVVVLDWLPNPNHVPLYVAQEMGFFRAEGLAVSLQAPTAFDPSDPAKLAASGRADLALTTPINLIVIRAQNVPLTAVGSLIQKPLGGLLALKERGIRTLADFKGRTIGYSLEPEEPVLWAAMLETAGLKPGDYRLLNVGFDTLPALLTGQVDAIGAFRNVEKILVEVQERKETVFFAMEEHGIPEHPQLVFVANEAVTQQKSDLFRRFLRAVARAVTLTFQDPARSFELFLKANPDLQREAELQRRFFDATVALFAGAPCHNQLEQWAKLQDFLFERKLIERRSELSKLVTVNLLPPECGL